MINIPSNPTVIFNRMAVDTVNELGELDPFLRNSVVKSLLVGYSNSIYEFYKTLEQVIDQAFWDTATDEYLERWAAIYGKTRNPATIATGAVIFTGIATTSIPIDTEFTSESGDFYKTTAAGTITAQSISVTSLTRLGTTVTVETGTDHGFATNQEITISGANETEYNGTFSIVATGLDTFTYEVTTTPSSPATGTILASDTFVNVPAESLETGSTQNLENGSLITLGAPIAGVDNTGLVSFDEISGGSDLESDTSLRTRFLERVQNPIALFNEAAIIDQAKEVSGVTRVWVQNVDFKDDSIAALSLSRTGDFAVFTTSSAHGLYDGQPITVSGATETGYNVNNKKIIVVDSTTFSYVVDSSTSTPATGSPVASFGVSALGQVRIFFVRDNDANIIPTPSEITTVENKILEIKPATSSNSDIIVDAPTPIIVNFDFTSISPDTADMRSAVETSLESFFRQGTNVAESLSEDTYRSVIINTIDNAGNKVQSFTLSTPTGDITVGVSELAILGTITWSI